MALVVKDRVKEITTTTGTSNLTLGGAVFGFQSFSVVGNGNQTYYAIYDSATGDWEVGVGTYSTTGPTLSRDTVLESSNSGSKVVLAAGSKDVFLTYPAERSVYLDTAGSAVTVLDIGTLGTSTANITTANITAGTISTTPTNSNDLVNKTYVDGIAAQGITYHQPVKYEVPNSTGNLNATYSNGTAGVGATLTNAGTKAAFAPDGPTAQVGDRVLVYNQTNAFENGVYEVTTVGTPDPGGTNWVLMRTADADSYGLKDPNALGSGDAFFVTSGNTGAGETYVCNTAGTITFGTTAITFAQISSAQIYSAGAGLTLSNLVFSITPVGTAGTFGSASSVPVFTTNAYGQITSTTNTAISISAGAVSGLAPSATTDTTNAANITSGTLPVARLSGSYTGITGVGTLAAGTWNASTIGATFGGTGLTTYAQGDLLYATSSTTLGRLADVVTGNALISGGVGADPSWGKIGLQTHVDGTLQLVNGGTGATTASGARSNLGLVIGTDIPSVTGSGASGTWNINITGNAATATTSTTSTTATQVSNSVTFNNSGAGAASGNGFNGSGALTVSYNTIGAPSTTGANASGTWGISISGNAATATTATNAPNYLPLSGGTMTGVITTVSSGTAINFSGQSDSFGYNGTSGLGTYIKGTGSTYIYGGGAFYDGSTMRTLLNSGNYNSYAPTLTGGGASGTWGINITGSAGSAGSVDYNNLTNKTGGTGTYTTSGDYRAPIFYDSSNTGYYVDPASTSVLNSAYVFTTFLRRESTTQSGISWYSPSYTAWSNYMSPAGAGGSGPTGNITAPSGTYVTSWALRSFIENAGGYGWTFESGTSSGQPSVVAEIRASDGLAKFNGGTYSPIFYDSDNTGYYVDPTGTTNLNLTRGYYWWTTYTSVNSPRWDCSFYVLQSQHWYSQTGAQTMYLGESGDFVYIRGYSTSDQSFRAPIFYDSSNTGYYVDPASVSYLYGLTLAGGSYFRPNNWIQFDSSYGLYWPNNNNAAELNANTSSSYGAIRLVGSRNGWDGFYSTFSAVNGFMYASNGNGGVYREANDRWYWYYHLSNDCMGIGTASTSSTYSLYLNKGVYAQSRIDATIFYDTNDTSYYLNPNSTSSLHSATCWSTWYFRSNTTTAAGSNPPLQAYSDNGSGAIMAFHRAGYYAVNMGLDSDNVLRIGGWSAPANLFQMDMSGNLTMAANVTAYSDERLKKDWSELPEDFVERLAAVKNGTYTRTDANMRQVGVGAQSLQGLLPEAVLDGEYLSVAYGNAALAACVELAKSVVALRAELNALRAH